MHIFFSPMNLNYIKRHVYNFTVVFYYYYIKYNYIVLCKTYLHEDKKFLNIIISDLFLWKLQRTTYIPYIIIYYRISTVTFVLSIPEHVTIRNAG